MVLQLVRATERVARVLLVRAIWLLLLLLQIDVPRFMSDAQRLAELIQAVKLQHQQEQLQQLLE
jgi:hypothetical protein